jgi:hypothetical protein
MSVLNAQMDTDAEILDFFYLDKNFNFCSDQLKFRINLVLHLNQILPFSLEKLFTIYTLNQSLWNQQIFITR